MNPSRAHCIEESYLKLMACVLAGYALLGKGFAYFGYPPVFVGEIVLVIGVVVLLHVGCVFASLATLPSVLLIITMVWTVFRTLPFLDVYALDALRDSVVILYGVFSFIIIALVLQDDRRVEMLIGYYRRFLVFFVLAIFFIYPISRLFPKYIPNGFATNIPLIWVDSGQVAVHLAGAALFALVGFRKAGLIWTALLIVTALMASAMSRGGMLAFVVPITIAMILLRRIRQLGLMLAISASILGCAYSIQTNFAEYQQPKGSKERSLNAQQMIDNIVSLFGQADRQTEGTKTWRLDWWGRILRDTVGGPHVAFSLDLRDGTPLGIGTRDIPTALAARAADAGVGAIIVLDLARVGMRTGVDLNLLKAVRKAVPEIELVAGGGVRDADDLAQLEGAGVNAALVATALRDGTLAALKGPPHR